MGSLKLTFYGGVDAVTGANFMLSGEDTKILVDCGLIQGVRLHCADDLNRVPFEYDPATVDYLIVTHAHTDHIGRIPKLVKDGFNGKIISTPATREIVEVMFDDALRVTEEEADRCNMKPLYSRKDVDKALALWDSLEYHEDLKLGDEFNLYLHDAGHIMGSAVAKITYIPEKKNVVFTGDLGNSPTPLIRQAEEVKDADYMVIESVYGDRNHEGKAVRKEKLRDVLNRVIERKGTLMIPVFSLEKTQVLLHEMNDLIEGGEVKSVPVFFDSPLGIKLTDIYARQFKYFNEKVQDRIVSGDDIFDFPKLVVTESAKDSKQIHKTPGPKVIIASSGMSVGGRILDHEKRYLKDPKNGILFIGYQVPGTLGRAISENKKSVKIDGVNVPIKAEIFVVNGYSSHMDSDHLLDFVSNSMKRLKKVFVVMGETRSAMFLTQKIRDNLDVDAVHPHVNQTVEL